MSEQEITNPAKLSASRDVWVLMQMTGKPTRQRHRAKFKPESLQAASIAVQHEYVDTVLQADQGVDLDFLVGKRGALVPRDKH